MSDEILFNPLLPEFHADPYPFYKRLREKEPVHQSPMGFWVLTRYEDCVAVLRDARFGREEFQQMLSSVYGDDTEKPALPRSMLFRDPPDHTRLRALVSKAFTPRMIETMRDHIQGIVDRLLDRVQHAGRMDVIEDLAYPLPVTVICEMLGVPVGDHASIRGWSADIARSLDAIGLPSDQAIVERGRTSRRALADYFRRLVPERRGRPQQDLLSGLIAAEEQGDKLTQDEVIAMCLLLFIAGHETTVNLIGNGTLALLRHPDQLQRLRAEPALVGNAVEELLRYDSPVQRTARITNTEAEVAGQPMPKGTMVITALGAANRDPAQFPDPDVLDVARKDPRHISFGFGIHFCLGAPLARVEGQLALGTLLQRMPKLALDEKNPEWRESSVLRGLKRLNVTF
ncbi:MAG TPA: cytochrome P450 [Candidatus Binatia bacterium]|nr:cytochrome P450 [Candidatus Binatia bacterium]